MKRRKIVFTLMIAGALYVGCNRPKCREVKPIAEVEKEIIHKVEKQLDDLDATKTQKKRIFALVRALMPAYEALRRETNPKLIAFMRELQAPAPQKERLVAVFSDLSNRFRRFSHAVVDVLLEANQILTPAQKAALLKRETKPKKPFQGSWMLDRSLDLFLLQINATREQKKLTAKLKDELIRRSQPVQKEFERRRRSMIAELGKPEPDPNALRADLEAIGAAIEAFVPEALAAYLKWHAGLSSDQVAVVNGYLRRFEPCDVYRNPPTNPQAAETAAGTPPQ